MFIWSGIKVLFPSCLLEHIPISRTKWLNQRKHYNKTRLKIGVRSIKSNMSWRSGNKFITKWTLVYVFTIILLVKYGKFTLFGLGEFFYLNKLQTRLFSWNISVFKVNECRKLYFLLLFITKYFMTIHIYQIMIFSPLLYLSWWTSL